MKILIDTREQTPLTFPREDFVSEVLNTKLDFGDYQATTEEGVVLPVCFERKTLGDLWGTLTRQSNHQRFNRELARAKRAGFSMILAIEGDIFKIRKGCDHSKFKGESMVRMVHTLWMRYGLFPLFCENKRAMARHILATFEAYGKEFKSSMGRPSAATQRGAPNTSAKNQAPLDLTLSG